MTAQAATGPRARGRWRFVPQLIVVGLVLGLLAAMAVEPTRRLLEQRARIEGMARDLGRVRVANRRLEARVDRLKDPDYLEQRAREQAGLVRPGETAYVVMPPTRRDARRDRTSHEAAAPPARPETSVGIVDGFLGFIGFD